MAKWYAAHNLTPADDASLQAVPNPGSYTELVTGDFCFVTINGLLHKYIYDSTLATTQDIPTWVTPDGNAGNGRWILEQTYITSANGFDVKQGPPTDSTLSFTDGTRTFSIQPTATDFNWYINGVHHTSEGDTVVITDVEGLHWIYYDTDGVLKVQAPGGSTDSLILEKCLVGNVYWDAVNNEGIIVGDERHGNDMAAATHYHFHESIGAVYESGLALSGFDIDGSGGDATAAQFDVSDGEFHDEDIEIAIVGGSPQQLTNATIPTFYRLGVGGLWRKLDATANFPVADGTIGLRLDWNDYNGGTWQLQEVTNLQFVLTHYFATNDINNPIIGIMGQDTYSNVNAARTGAETELASIDLAGLPGAEYIPIATVIWQTADAYGNQVAARIRSTDLGANYIDWRSSSITGSAATPNDHESLANLFGGAAADHFHLTSVQETDLTDGGESTLHYHNALKDGGVIGAVCAAAGTTDLNYAGNVAFTTSNIGVRLFRPGSALTYTQIYMSPGGQLNINSLNDGAIVAIQGKTTAGAAATLISSDPDSSTDLYHIGVKTLSTYLSGINVQDTSGNSAILSWTGGTEFRMIANKDSAHTALKSKTSASAYVYTFLGDPDGAANLYHAGIKAFHTYNDAANSGLVVNKPDGTGAGMFLISTADLLSVYNQEAGGHLVISGVKTGTGYVKFVDCDPDGSVDLYFNGSIAMDTTIEGINVRDTTGANAVLNLTNNNGTAYATLQTTSAVTNDLWISTVAASGDIYLSTQTSSVGLKINDGGSADLYYAGTAVVKTKTGGLQLYVSGTNYADIQQSVTGKTYVWNKNPAGEVNIVGTSTGSADHNMILLDPDEGVKMYYNNILIYENQINGNRGTSIFYDALGAGNAQIQVDSVTDAAYFYTPTDGAVIYIGGTSSGYKVGIAVDPAAQTTLHHNGVQSIGTAADGGVIYRNVTYAAKVWGDATNWYLTHYEHGAPWVIQAENASGVMKNLFKGDPDSEASLFYAGTATVTTKTDGMYIYSASTGTVYPLVFRNSGAFSTSNYSSIAFQMSTSTTAYQNTMYLLTRFSDTTHATRKSQIILQGLYNAAVHSVWDYTNGSFRAYYQNTLNWYTVSGGVYIVGNCSALTFTDRTPSFEGNAVEEIKKIKGTNGKIDHSTLPEFARSKVQLDQKGEEGDEDYEPAREEDGRDLGAMISILTKAVQELSDEIDELKNK